MTLVIQQINPSTVVAESNELTVIVEERNNILEVQASPPSPIVEFLSNGPQGATGPQGEKGIELDETAKIDGSVIYYHAASATFRADTSVTTSSLTDGGNF